MSTRNSIIAVTIGATGSPSDLHCMDCGTAQPAKVTPFDGDNTADVRKTAAGQFFQLTSTAAGQFFQLTSGSSDPS
jgi:hypothetical protein